jgi:uncharacterized protein
MTQSYAPSRCPSCRNPFLPEYSKNAAIMNGLPHPEDMPADFTPDEVRLWQLVTAQFGLGPYTEHGPSHWRTVRRNGLYLARVHPADEEIIRLFSLFHDSCREDEGRDPQHGPRGAMLALAFRQAGHFHLNDSRMDLLVTACEIHNGGPTQSEPTLAVCLDADRLDLGRVGITPDPARLSTSTAKDIANRQAWHELAE